MKLIYIAGPYRADNAWEVEQNVRQAENIGFDVAELGAMPVIPHTMTRFFDGTLNDRFWLKGTLALMHVCDAMVLCPGWRKSEGALKEYGDFGGPVFENLQNFEKWLNDPLSD